MGNYIIISDIPTPWREPVFERVYRKFNGKIDIVYFNNNEKRRLWNFKMGNYPKIILKAITFTTNGTERFFNPELIPLLIKSRPRIAIVFACIKDPSGWIAMSLCKLLGIKVALLDDTWLGRDQGINPIQRMARHIVYKFFGNAFVGTSLQTLVMMKYYNSRISKERCFLSHLVADNEYFESRLNNKKIERRFDVMFSGRIVNIKNPLFFAEVCAKIKSKLGKCSVLIIGEGDETLKIQMQQIFEQYKIYYEFAGFIKHEELPDYYSQAKLLLLPTSGDCWGVVLNEAMVCGLPVITTNMTAAAGELVIDGENGYILPLDSELWAEKICSLLTDEEKYKTFSLKAKEKVSEFTFERAAQGIIDAIKYLENLRK
jgi:glycosyltransferase involved in cell wall biosynthesis